ncbi:MAG: hypothetical protein KDC92_09185, partial [Bacteroidetes bacterium]|nr:hypothetical protein [Bacteroidota bacterium]
MRYGIFHFIVFLLVFLAACAGDGSSTSSIKNDEQQNRLAQFKSPPHGKKFRLGETVEVEIELLAENANAKVFVNKQMMQSGSGKSFKGVIPEELKILGRNNIEYEVTANG